MVQLFFTTGLWEWGRATYANCTNLLSDLNRCAQQLKEPRRSCALWSMNNKQQLFASKKRLHYYVSVSIYQQSPSTVQPFASSIMDSLSVSWSKLGFLISNEVLFILWPNYSKFPQITSTLWIKLRSNSLFLILLCYPLYLLSLIKIFLSTSLIMSMAGSFYLLRNLVCAQRHLIMKPNSMLGIILCLSRILSLSALGRL